MTAALPPLALPQLGKRLLGAPSRLRRAVDQMAYFPLEVPSRPPLPTLGGVGFADVSNPDGIEFLGVWRPTHVARNIGAKTYTLAVTSVTMADGNDGKFMFLFYADKANRVDVYKLL